MIQHDGLNNCKFRATQFDRFGIYLHWNELDCNIRLTFYMWSVWLSPLSLSYWQFKWKAKRFVNRANAIKPNRYHFLTAIQWWLKGHVKWSTRHTNNIPTYYSHHLCVRISYYFRWYNGSLYSKHFFLSMQIIFIFWARFSSWFLVTLKVESKRRNLNIKWNIQYILP